MGWNFVFSIPYELLRSQLHYLMNTYKGKCAHNPSFWISCRSSLCVLVYHLPWCYLRSLNPTTLEMPICNILTWNFAFQIIDLYLIRQFHLHSHGSLYFYAIMSVCVCIKGGKVQRIPLYTSLSNGTTVLVFRRRNIFLQR